MNKRKRNKFCFRCHLPVEKETELYYSYFCPNCNENMFSFEVHDGDQSHTGI